MTATPTPSQIRAHAVRAITQVVIHDRTIDWVISERAQWCQLPLERDLIYGVIRHYFSLHKKVDAHLEKPLRKKDQDLLLLMLVGAYQLIHSSIPAHAVINETVQAVVALHKPWAKNLVNVVLRNISRGIDPASDLSVEPSDHSFDHPEWLIAQIRRQYPLIWQQILAANNTRAPMTVRVNTCRISHEDYLRKLQHAAIDAETGSASNSLVLLKPQPSNTLPGWARGDVAIQDMGAQFAAQLLVSSLNAPTRQMPLRILDACAAPGGKLAHLYEMLSESGYSAELMGIDMSIARVKQTQMILARLGHDVTVSVADARQLDWWDGKPYSHILLDAPCSGTGTIRRHPDIKILLQAESISEHANQQLQILNNLWQTLASGGNLLYCTCSLLRAENDDVVGRFLQHQNKDANVQTIKLSSGAATKYGWQLLPTDSYTDGFYFALLQKRSHHDHQMTDADT